MPKEKERVEKQKADKNVGKKLPAAWRPFGELRGSPQYLEERTGGQQDGEVLDRNFPQTLQPSAQRRRRLVRGDLPRANPPTDSGQEVQQKERCAKSDVGQESAHDGQVRAE